MPQNLTKQNKKTDTKILGSHITHLQVPGDGMVGSMGDHKDAIGLADHAMTLLDLPCVPVSDTRPHDGHA